MNALKKEKKVILLGKCPNCGNDLHEDSYVAIPLKEAENTLFGSFQESLMICNDCSNNPEVISLENITDTLRQSKLKWGEAEIVLVVKAVTKHQNVMLNFKNQNKDQFQKSKN